MKKLVKVILVTGVISVVSLEANSYFGSNNQGAKLNGSSYNSNIVSIDAKKKRSNINSNSMRDMVFKQRGRKQRILNRIRKCVDRAKTKEQKDNCWQWGGNINKHKRKGIRDDIYEKGRLNSNKYNMDRTNKEYTQKDMKELINNATKNLRQKDRKNFRFDNFQKSQANKITDYEIQRAKYNARDFPRYK